jgi:hypothetical protein
MVFRRFPVAAPRVAGRCDMKSNPCASSAIQIFYKQIPYVEGKKRVATRGNILHFCFILFEIKNKNV